MEELLNKIRELIFNIGNDLGPEYKHEYKINTNIKELFNNLQTNFLSDDEFSLVLGEDTYLELGNAQTPSCRLLVPVIQNDEISDGKITVFGPEISKDIPEKSVFPFSQIIFIYSERPISPDLYRKLQIHLSVFNIIKGFMIRAIPRKFWIRLNKEIVQSGFNLKYLGEFLVFHIKKQFFEISKIEIVFITTSEEKISDLEKISDSIKEIYADTEIRKKVEKIEAGQIPADMAGDKKRFECDYEWSCSECEYNEICDDIIDIINKMRKYKEEHKT